MLLCSDIIFYVFNIVDLFMYWLKITCDIMYVIVIWKMPSSWGHGLCLHAVRTYVRACACSQGVEKVVWVPAPSLIREEGSGTLLRTPQYLCMVRQLSVKLSSLCICAMLMCNLLFHFQCNQLWKCYRMKISRFTTTRVVNIDKNFILLLAMYKTYISFLSS